MKKKITIKDIAAKANVSTGTVDRVLHKRGKVSKAKKERVEQAIKELDYQPNLLASALAFNHNFQIVALLPDPKSDYYWNQVKLGVEKAIQATHHFGFVVHLHYFDYTTSSSLKKEAQKILKGSIDGLLFPPMFLKESKWLLKACEERQIPAVIINTHIQNNTAFSYIGQDSYQSGVLAARLLNFGLNHGETALLLNLDFKTKAAQHLITKEEGFRSYFEKVPNKKINIIRLDFEDFDYPERLALFLQKTLQEHPKLAGIFVTNSRAYKIVDLLDDETLNRIKIVGFDLVEPNLRHIHDDKINFLINQNPLDQGRIGVMNLFNHLIQKKQANKIQYLPLDIVVKENVQYYLERQNK